MEPKKPKRIVIVQHERALKVIVADMLRAVLWVPLIGTGVVLDSAAMQWVGAILFMLVMVDATRIATSRLTIPEARKALDRIEAAEGRPDA